MSQKTAKRLLRLEDRTYVHHSDRRKDDRRRESVFFLTIFLIVLFAMILTLKVSAAVTGDTIGKQLYVATHTSDISTTEEIQQVMREADEIWP